MLASHDDARAEASFERLEQLVRQIVERQRGLQKESKALRRRLEERDARVAQLEEQLLQANQARRDVAKRIDDLINQVDALAGAVPPAESEG